MNFRMADWADADGVLSGEHTAAKALDDLIWSLTNLETPQPIGLDLQGVSAISGSFATGFFAELLRSKPESYFGPHPLVAFGATPGVAQALHKQLADRGLAIPIARST